ncbi:13835_t:CDS:1, partial [Racocetra fulgida]
MSEILGSITGALGRLFKNLLPSWGDPTPPKLPEPSEPPVLEEEPGSEEEGENDYKTALAYQNTETRWYSAIRRFLFWKKQGNNIEFYDGSTQWTGSENDFRVLLRDWFVIKANLNETLQEAHKYYNEEAEEILWR